MNFDPDAAARLLWSHWQAGSKIDALPAALRPADRGQGHAVQARLPGVGDRAVVGWKIAATSSAGQAHIGVAGPLAGRLLAGQVDGDGATQSLRGNAMRVAEPEFAFRFGRDLPPRPVAYTVDEVLAAVDTLHPAIEVPDSRFADFVRAGEAQLLADNACAHRFVLGAPAAEGWRALDLRAHRVAGRVFAGGGLRLAREGDGSAVLGDPRLALTWLVNELAALGIGLAAGRCVTTGTCMVPLEIGPGDRVVADYGVLGAVAVQFTD
jgi:2-keto-4-pentenoate hydratase